MATDVNLLDLTNQPNGIILGDGVGYPLFSIEDAYGYQFDVTNQRLDRLSSGVETLKYSTDLAETSTNHTYELSFNIKLAESPDNIGTEAKIEFQNGIDGNIGSTFFELPYDELINLNFGGSSEYTTFTAQYTSPLEGQSIFFIKTTEVKFFIENLKIIDLGIVEEEEDELFDEGGSTDSVYIRACICDDSGAANQLGSFEEDFLKWEEENQNDIENFNAEGFSLHNFLGDTYGLPEGVYPTNCIGFHHAEDRFKSKYSAFQDGTTFTLDVVHDPQLCIFGGAELDNDKQNLIGLTNEDFITNNLFNIDNSLNEYSKLEVEMGENNNDYNFIFLNKSGVEGHKVSLPYDGDGQGEHLGFDATLYYDFTATKTETYYPQMNYSNDDNIEIYEDGTWPYKSFSYSFNPNKVEPFPWISNYTTSENIYPYYNHGGKPEEESIPVVLIADSNDDNINDDNGENHEWLFSGKCPPQFEGEEKDNKFGTHTLSGFGPMMCSHKHFDKVFNDWMEGDDIENPLIKPSSPSSGTLPTIETNPDASDVEIPVFANFPDNPTYNFLKEKFNNIYPNSYKKYLLIKIEAVYLNNFVTIKYQDTTLNEVLIDLTTPDASGDVNVKIDITDITPTEVDINLNASDFREQYGNILFTPAEADLEVQSQIKYNFTHEFLSNEEDQNDVIKSNFRGDFDSDFDNAYPNGYNGVKFYNYGSAFYSYLSNFNVQLNTHFEQLWTNVGTPAQDAEDRFVETEYYIGHNETSNVLHYPNKYWTFEFDEQRELEDKIPGMTDYTNYFHWTNPYSLFEIEYNNNNYWKYDNPTLYSYFLAFNATYGGDDLDIEFLYDNPYVPNQNSTVASNVPWPEQIINGYGNVLGTFDGSFNSDIAYTKTKVLTIFDGEFNGFTHINIYITGTLQFSGEFGLDGFDIDLNPSLDKSYDPFSGIDLRPEIIDDNICQHIELMTRQNLSTGDGVFYKASEHPLADADEQLVTCNTFINFNFYPFTKIRARCGDGSVVLMGDTGRGDTIEYPQDFFYSSGINACTYASNHIRSYPNNEKFHFGANLDKRPSLGLFYYEEGNQASENFTANLGDEFQQYPNTNLVTNGNGSIVETVETYYADGTSEGEGEDEIFEGAPDSYHPAGWLTGFFSQIDPVFRERNTLDYMGYREYGQYTHQFIQSPDFNPDLGYYRFVGYETYSHMNTFDDEAHYKEWTPRWIFEETEYEYKGDTKDNTDNWGEAGKFGFIYASGKHPTCHSAGKCLNFNANKSMINASWNKSIRGNTLEGNSFAPYIHLNQFQEILDANEATQLFYHDVQSTPDLKVSFWMYTSSDGVTGTNYIEPLDSSTAVSQNGGHNDVGESYGDLSNPKFPKIEIAVVKGDPLNNGGEAEGVYHPKAALSSLSNDDNIASSGMFKNTVLDEWERFEFSFNLEYGRFYNEATRKFTELNLLIQYSGIEVLNINGELPSFDADDNFIPGNRYEVIPGNVYLDDFSVTETGVFIPDVDVRAKKGEGNYGIGSLTEYYDPLISEPLYYDNDGLPGPTQLEAYNDTTAPLEAQFIFYPRFFNEQVFDREEGLVGRFGSNATFSAEVIKNDFRRGRFYLYDVDFGDGSEKEFTDTPLRLGNNIAVYHTYTKSGIYEVTGYMLRTRPSKNEDGTPNHDEPIGVLHNKKFTVRINVNEGLDEDFTYFGSEDGFSYIPYKNTSPVVGGISKESSYYKAIKRQLGFITDEVKTSIFFEKESDKLKTEIALSKMDSTFNDAFEILPEFQIPRYSEPLPTDGTAVQGGELIYGGITLIEEELGKSLGNVDLTNARYFNEPKEIYQMFGFTCDNNLTDLDLIPLGNPEYGLNFSNHSSIFTDRSDIQSPYFSNVSKVANSKADGSLEKDKNPIRFGHDFRIDDIDGLGVGQWNHIQGRFVDTPAFNTPDLGYNQTYTYSTHIYIPFGYCEDGSPCSENENQDGLMMCSECTGTQQYVDIESPLDFNVRIVQNVYEVGGYGMPNDWAHDLWLDDEEGGQWANQHNIGPFDEQSFKYAQFDAFNHCHPKGVNNQRFKYAWGQSARETFQFRTDSYCNGFATYQECGLTNPSGDVDGCYWEGSEDGGYCLAANLVSNVAPYDQSCWTAVNETQCNGGCEWYGDGSDNANYETLITIPHGDIITDEWFRLDFPFTAKEPSEFGNHISLRFDTHLGVNETTLEYLETGGDLVTNGSFADPPDNISNEYLATLPSPSCFEEFDVAAQDGILNVQDRIKWLDEDYGRPDVSAKIAQFALADDEVEAAGGYCPNGYDGIDYEIFRNPSIGGWFLESWELYGDTNFSSAKINIPFGDSPSSAEQYHLQDNTSYNKIYKLKYEVITPTIEEDSKLLIVADPDGYSVEQSIELPTDVVGVQEVIFTSDNDAVSGGGSEGDPNRTTEDEGGGLSVFYERTLIIGHLGGYNNNDSVIIDNVELHKVTENEINTTTSNEGLYTFGAQLLAGDFSGDDLINYTTEDLNPGDCADFQGGNPSNPRYWKNIIPQNYDIFVRGASGAEYSSIGGNLMPHPQDVFLGTSPSGTELSDFWYYDENHLSCVYNYENNSYEATLLQENASQGDGEEFKVRFSRPEYHGLPELMSHMTGDCDSFNSCLARLDVENLSHWYQFKFTYTKHIPQTSNSENVPVPQPIESIGVRFNGIVKIKADNWNIESETPNDGTTIVSMGSGEPTMWIYGDSSTDYQGEKHPDFWEQANCVEGQECIVWILFKPYGENYGDNYNHEIGFLNGIWGNNSVTVWKNLSLMRGDEILDSGGGPALTDIDYNSEQEWLGTSEYGNTYYYPVLPKFGLNGKFESANNQFYPGGNYDYPNDNIPFPINAMVTKQNPQEQSMLINIYNDVIETNVFTDGSGNDNNAFAINDYKPKYNEQTSEPQSIINVDRIRTSKDKGAF